ncbi:MAG TPA: FG-GAP repeat protein, partial [Kofleriaceae bacterium]|nr:FG-GAP repeat protein [Kofleriaceae bacterium]
MQRLAWPLPLLAALTGCSQVLGLHDVTVEHHVGGRLHGLWDGADGVALQLKTDSINALLTVSANGLFQFPDLLAPGVSYTVTVAANPVQHTCVIDAGGNGMVADAEVTSLSIACTGPTMSVTLSGPWEWSFDPTEETQTFAGSIVTQEVAVMVSGTGLRSASVDGAAVTLGEKTAPIALPLGQKTVPITLTASGGLSKTYQLVFGRGTSVLDQIAYGKASNTGAFDEFGTSVALSGDTLAVGAYLEDSNATGVNGNQADNSAKSAGAVYVFVRQGITWTQQAYLKASNTGANNYFGYSVALFGDTLAVGASGEASSAGAVYVFIRQGITWTQQAYIKASNAEAGDDFGTSVALSGDTLSGDTLAIGASCEASNATGVNGNQADNSAFCAGAVYVFIRQGTTWTQQAYLKASNPENGDEFGRSVALSGDTLAIGAPYEASNATGVNGNQSDNSASFAGAVYVFVRQGATWTQQAYLKASNTG